MDSSQEFLQIKSVSKQFVNHKALDEVSFDIPKGSIFGLLGPNGAGKTTLIRILNQITLADQGEVLFDGELLQPDHTERIGYLPEERGLYKKMKVYDQIVYFARLKNMSKTEAKEKTIEWMTRFDIMSWKNKKVEELSKGMQQKVQFIITVLHEPDLIILDEPFSGFDPINTELIMTEIRRLRDNGATVIFSTHRMESVEEICDHVGMINLSRKVLEGRVDTIRENHSGKKYTVEFSGDYRTVNFNPINIEKTRLGGTICDFEVPREDVKQLIQELNEQVDIQSFALKRATMHEVFVAKVKEGENG
jgi:ABC-2 type transport system ATP-binding protein